MQSHGPLDALPLWGLFMAILLLALLAVEGGYRLGKYRRSRSEQEQEAPVGAMVGATLGLLAFMLAFTFGLAAARFDTRRQVLLDEANAIGTAYLRAGMLSDRREAIRALLRDYVDTRLKPCAWARLRKAYAGRSNCKPSYGRRQWPSQRITQVDFRRSLRTVAQ